MSTNWNSYGNQSLNGVSYEAPPGFEDRAFDYVLPDPQQFAGGVLVPAGATVDFEQFLDQGSLFLLLGIEVPPTVSSLGTADYGYNTTLQLYLDNEQVFADSLNNICGFGNQSAPLPVFPVRWIGPGTVVKIEVRSYETVVDYYNFAVVLRGLRRYQSARAAA